MAKTIRVGDHELDYVTIKTFGTKAIVIDVAQNCHIFDYETMSSVVLQEGSGTINRDLSLSNDGTLLAGWTGSSLNVWDMQTGLTKHRMACNPRLRYLSIRISPNGIFVCFVVCDMHAMVWDTRDHSVQLVFTKRKRFHSVSCWFIADNQLVVKSNSTSYVVEYWNLRLSVFAFSHVLGVDGDFAVAQVMGHTLKWKYAYRRWLAE